MDQEKPAAMAKEQSVEAAKKASTGRDELMSALNDAEAIGAPLQEEASLLVQEARRHRDLAYQTKRFVSDLPPSVDFESREIQQTTTAWQALNRKARETYGSVKKLRSAYVVQATTTGVSTSTTISETLWLPMIASDLTADQDSSLHAIDSILHDEVALDRAHLLCALFNLDLAHGDFRSAADLLLDANTAFARPPREVPSPASVLIPLREAIHRTVDELLKRCPPPQRKAHGIAEKIVMIGERCGREQYSTQFFVDLGASAARKINLLSSGKDREIQRDQLGFLYRDALAFLIVFLEAIHPDRLSST